MPRTSLKYKDEQDFKGQLHPTWYPVSMMKANRFITVRINTVSSEYR